MADDHRGVQRTGVTLIGIGVLAVVSAVIFGIISPSDDPAASASPSPSAVPSASPSATPASFVTTDGQDLMLDGAQFRYAGANAYTLMFEAPSSLAVYMKTAKDAHFTV